MQASEVLLPLGIGARSLWTFRRRLVRRRIALSEALGGDRPILPDLADGEHGHFLTGVPETWVETFRLHQPNLKPFIRQRYRRSYAELRGGFEAYLDRFSAKSRSTLKRKTRKLAEAAGGTVDVRVYCTAADMARFHADARSVSSLSYQERLLDAGLPGDAASLRAMQELAASDSVRGWILYVHDRPIAYLYAPAEDQVLIYAYLGYDPEYAHLSPGTVLQVEVMRQLFEQDRFRWLDFTEGDGQQKRQFSTAGVDCVDLLLLKPSPGNLAIAGMLRGFDDLVALVKRGLNSAGAGGVVRQLRR